MRILNHERQHAPFLVLNFGLYIVDSVRRLHLKGDGFTSESLYKDLHDDSSDWSGKEIEINKDTTRGGYIYMMSEIQFCTALLTHVTPYQSALHTVNSAPQLFRNGAVQKPLFIKP